MSDDTQSNLQEPVEETPATTSDGGSVSEAKADSSEVNKTEEKAEEPKKAVSADRQASKAVSKDLEKIIEQIEKLTVLELADLVHALEEKFGVTASVPVGTGQAGASGAPTGDAEPVEEKITFNVILSSGGANKIAAIKAVREIVPTLGLKEAKDLVEAAPKPVLESVNKATAEEAKAKLTAAGATVELQ